MIVSYDLIIRNAMIVDGTGQKTYKGDLAVKDGKICKIGFLQQEIADHVIDAKSNVLAPGFIDSHSHSDLKAASMNNHDGKITQGVTTEITGNCGLSIAPVSEENRELLKKYLEGTCAISGEWNWSSVGDWLKVIDNNGYMTDLGFLIGHGSVRIAAAGFGDQELTKYELDSMKSLVVEGMEQGAFGLSTGLVYPPGYYATKNEIIELCKIVHRYGGVYATHIRDEGGESHASVLEAIEIGRRSGCKVHISHHKVMGKLNAGLSINTLTAIEKANKEGMNVTFDVYPYLAGSSALSCVLPPWSAEGGVDKILSRLSTHSDREHIREDMKKDIPGWQNFSKLAGWENIKISNSSNNKALEGKSIAEIASARRKAPDETALDILLSEKCKVAMIHFSLVEEDFRRIISHPMSMIGSDGLAVSSSNSLDEGKPHPRCCGCFPRVLSWCVREEHLLSLEQAVWKMTGFIAQWFGIRDRGFLKEGLKADMVLFDPNEIRDNATYEEPTCMSSGILAVFKNGQVVVKDGELTGKILGRSLRYEP